MSEIHNPVAESECKSPERLLLDELRLWSDMSGPATDTRARFACVTPGGLTSLLLRDIQTDILRDGSGDWEATYTDSRRTWTARSDTITGAVLTMIARMCGLDGEIRGYLPEAADHA